MGRGGGVCAPDALSPLCGVTVVGFISAREGLFSSSADVLRGVHLSLDVAHAQLRCVGLSWVLLVPDGDAYQMLSLGAGFFNYLWVLSPGAAGEWGACSLDSLSLQWDTGSSVSAMREAT